MLGIMNSFKYDDILNWNLVNSTRKIKMGHHCVSQLEHYPKYVNKSTQN